MNAKALVEPPASSSISRLTAMLLEAMKASRGALPD
jgi:hypothetical protein